MVELWPVRVSLLLILLKLLSIVSPLALSLLSFEALVVQKFRPSSCGLGHSTVLRVDSRLESWLGLLIESFLVLDLSVLVHLILSVNAHVFELQVDHFDLFVRQRESLTVNQILDDLELVEKI